MVTDGLGAIRGIPPADPGKFLKSTISGPAWDQISVDSGGMQYVGAYNPATTYNDGDYVIGDDGITYVCVVNGTVGIAPTPWGGTTVQQTGIPLPIVNGQWIKGVGGAAVWSPISQADLPLNLQAGVADPPVMDCNSLSATGWYWINNTVANSPAPGNFNGYLQNYVAGWSIDHRLQVAYAYSEAGISFRRQCVGGVWSAWRGDLFWHNVGAAGEPAFQNGWQNYGGWPPARFRMSADGTVFLQGLVSSGTVQGGVPIFTLPPAYRPAGPQGHRYAAIANNALAACNVYSTGVIDCEVGSNAYLFLNFTWTVLT